MAKKFTVRGLEAIKSEKTRKEIPDGMVIGLYLVVQPTGKRSWAVRYRVGNRTRKHTLGSASAIGLVNARELARAALVEVAKGNDPGEAKKAARNAKPKLTLGALISAYIEKYAKMKTKQTVAQETERALRRELEHLTHRSADSITRREIKDLIEDRVTDGFVATAQRLRALVSKMFNWAVEEDYLKESPCNKIPTIKAPEPRERNLSAAEIVKVMVCTENYENIFGIFLRFLLCTGQRRTMTAQTTWTEIDIKNKVWTIPKERTKNGKQHIVHLSRFACDLLSDIPRILDEAGLSKDKQRIYIFPNQDGDPISGFSDRKNAFDQFMMSQKAHLGPWTLHDLRRTAATSMSELGVDQVIIDMILSHQTSRTKDVGLIYNRNQQLKKRQEALEMWGEFLRGLGPWYESISREEYGEEYAAQKIEKAEQERNQRRG